MVRRYDLTCFFAHENIGAAVLQHAELSKFEHPKQRELAQLQQWLTRPSQGAIYFIGLDRNTWANAKPYEMMSISPRHPRDEKSPFSSSMSGRILHLYHRLIGQHWRVSILVNAYGAFHELILDSELEISGTYPISAMWRIILKPGYSKQRD